jgi:hypothetical protein
VAFLLARLSRATGVAPDRLADLDHDLINALLASTSLELREPPGGVVH